MKIELEEKTHTYFVDGEIASISITELLRKHGLAPDYGSVSKAKLAERSEVGKEVHKDLEYVLNKAKYTPKTQQGKDFKRWVTKNIDCGVGEQMLAYEKDGVIFAGTADVMAFMKDGSLMVGDHKNTFAFHREYVSWQVSLLDYFARQLEEPVNGNNIHWKGATKFYCFHYDTTNGKMKVIELDKVPDEEIEKLINCEIAGETYKRPVLVVDKDLQVAFEEAENYLIAKEREFKMAEAKAKDLRQKLCDLCEQQGIKSWETPDGLVKITYIAPTDNITVDSKKLKEEFPKAYIECQKLYKKKSFIRVTIRDGEE